MRRGNLSGDLRIALAAVVGGIVNLLGMQRRLWTRMTRSSVGVGSAGTASAPKSSRDVGFGLQKSS